MKRYMNAALVYAVLAMAGGVFYREFTKFVGFTGETTLSVVHTHYFMLGMALFLLLLLLEKSFSFTTAKTGRVLIVYHVGLNLTAVMFLVRGVTQALGTALSSGMDAAISGVAGIGHILLGVSLVLLLLQVKRALPSKAEIWTTQSRNCWRPGVRLSPRCISSGRRSKPWRGRKSAPGISPRLRSREGASRPSR